MKHDANQPQRDAALLDACRRSDTETALRLIAEGADIRAEDEELMTPMGYACQAGNEAIVDELLRRGISPNEESGNWWRTAFYRATESGNIALMRKLMLAGADLWALDCEDDSCLSAAIASGNPAALDFLLDMGLYIEDESPYSNPFMFLALRNGEDAMFRHLRRSGGNIHFLDYNDALFQACIHGLKEVARRLLTEPQNLPTRSVAASHHFYDMALSANPFDAEWAEMFWEAGLPFELDEELLTNIKTEEAREWAHRHAQQEQSNAAVLSALNREDESGRTALQRACQGGNTDDIRRLLAAGADAAGMTKSGESCLTLLRHDDSGGPEGCVALLLQHGCDPEHIGIDGMTALTFLIAHGKESLALELLHCGVDIGHRDEAAYTPFLAAARYGNAAIARRLAELGADTHATLPDGRTALHLAAQYQQEEVVRYLLSEGHEVNARDCRDYTPLLSCPSPAIAHLLLDAGADPLCRGKNGLTALMAVRHSNELGIRDRLLSAGVDPEATTLWGAQNPEHRWY